MARFLFISQQTKKMKSLALKVCASIPCWLHFKSIVVVHRGYGENTKGGKIYVFIFCLPSGHVHVQVWRLTHVTTLPWLPHMYSCINHAIVRSQTLISSPLSQDSYKLEKSHLFKLTGHLFVSDSKWKSQNMGKKGFFFKPGFYHLLYMVTSFTLYGFVSVDIYAKKTADTIDTIKKAHLP